MIESGMDVKTVSEIVGASVNTILAVYTHSSAQRKYQGTLILDKALRENIKEGEIFESEVIKFDEDIQKFKNCS